MGQSPNQTRIQESGPKLSYPNRGTQRHSPKQRQSPGSGVRYQVTRSKGLSRSRVHVTDQVMIQESEINLSDLKGNPKSWSPGTERRTESGNQRAQDQGGLPEHTFRRSVSNLEPTATQVELNREAVLPSSQSGG